MNEIHPPPKSEPVLGGTDYDSRGFYDECRCAAARAARAALGAVQQYYARQFPGMEGRRDEGIRMSYAKHHSGAAPRPQDVAARTAASKVVRDFLLGWGVAEDRIVFGGEEEGTATVKVGDYIVRLDSLDGTTNSETTFDSHAAVVMIDRVRQGDRGTRHLAGAIVSVTGWCVSWLHWSSYDERAGGYRQVRGAVYISNENWGVPEQEVLARRADRAVGAVAAVATGAARRADALKALHGLGLGDPVDFYTVAGTPMAAALLAGGIALIVEPRAVSLHDSALLLPHQILGGRTTTSRGGPLNPLEVYERNADDLRPDAKPFTEGYVAWAADDIPASATG